MSIRHVESFENLGDERSLAKTVASTVFLTVDLDTEKLACQAVIGDIVHFGEPGLNFDYRVGSVFWVEP